MEEVSGPVVAIALILAAVFVPTIFIPGITGRLYQQFAVTIAISVIFSAFNALSLSPALAALLLKPKKKSRGPLARFFDWFNRMFAHVTHGYVTFSAVLMRKAVISLVFLVAMGVLAVSHWAKAPIFVSCPRRTKAMCSWPCNFRTRLRCSALPQAASKVEDIILNTPGVQGCTSVIGFSLLSLVQNTYSAFFFVTVKPWDERKADNEQYSAIRAHIASALAGVQDGIAFSFPPPSIPGVGTSGGVTFVLEDRSGADLSFLTETSISSCRPLLPSAKNWRVS